MDLDQQELRHVISCKDVHSVGVIPG